MEGFYGKPGSKSLPCPANFYCQAAAEQPVPCPSGTISVHQSTDISNCVSGPGFYGYPGKPATICPEDTFCPVGAYQPQQCPQGFMASIGSAKLNECVVQAPDTCTLNTDLSFHSTRISSISDYNCNSNSTQSQHYQLEQS